MSDTQDLFIRDVPQKLITALDRLAKAARRSRNQHVLHMLEVAVCGFDESRSLTEGDRQDLAAVMREVLAGLCGAKKEQADQE